MQSVYLSDGSFQLTSVSVHTRQSARVRIVYRWRIVTPTQRGRPRVRGSGAAEGTTQRRAPTSSSPYCYYSGDRLSEEEEEEEEEEG